MKTAQQEFKPAYPIHDLKPHPDNPRQGDVGAIHQSIEANGFYGAVLVQKSTGYILAGNHRYQAALNHEADSLPAIIIDVDALTATRILLADNRTNDLATYDNHQLLDLLTGLAEDHELWGTGYDGDDLDDLLNEMKAEDGIDATDGSESSDESDTRVVVGAYSMTIPRARFIEWRDELREEVGYDEAMIKDEIKSRLGL